MPGLGVRQHDEVNEAHDLLEQKALDHGDNHRRRQVEDMELQHLGDAPSPHSEYIGE